MVKFLFGLFCVVALASVSEATRYDGYRVYRVNFYTEEQFNMLYQMDLRSNKEIMFWQLTHAGHYADIMVAPHKVTDLLALLDVNGFTYNLLIEDVQKNIDSVVQPRF